MSSPPDTSEAAFFADLAAGRAAAFRAGGESMLPNFPPGTLFLVAPCAPAELRLGDLVLVVEGDIVRLHRLVALSLRGARTRGDACWQADPPLDLARIRARAVSWQDGEVWRDVPRGAHAALLARLSRWGLLAVAARVTRRLSRWW